MPSQSRSVQDPLRRVFLIQTLLIEFYWNFPGSRMDLLFMSLVIILSKRQPGQITNSG